MSVFSAVYLLPSKPTPRGQSLFGQNNPTAKALRIHTYGSVDSKDLQTLWNEHLQKTGGEGSRGVNTENPKNGRMYPSVLAAPDGRSDLYNYLRLRVNVARDRRASSMARCSALPYSMQLRRRSSIAPQGRLLTREGI